MIGVVEADREELRRPENGGLQLNRRKWQARILPDRSARRIKQVRFNDDVDMRPWRTLLDLEAALRDTPVDRLAFRVRAFFAGRAVAMPSLTPDDFVAVVRRALALPLIAQNP